MREIERLEDEIEAEDQVKLDKEIITVTDVKPEAIDELNKDSDWTPCCAQWDDVNCCSNQGKVNDVTDIADGDE